MHLVRSGILLVDKPEGPSSARVVATAKRITGARKVGHLGTLDPFASGLLPLAVNEGTKIAQHFLDADKGLHRRDGAGRGDGYAGPHREAAVAKRRTGPRPARSRRLAPRVQWLPASGAAHVLGAEEGGRPALRVGPQGDGGRAGVAQHPGGACPSGAGEPRRAGVRVDLFQGYLCEDAGSRHRQVSGVRRPPEPSSQGGVGAPSGSRTR